MNHYKSDWYSSQSSSNWGLPPILVPYTETHKDVHQYDKQPSKSRKNKSSAYRGNVLRIRRAGQITARAAGIGIALSAVDGPLPIGDTIGFIIFAAASVGAWTDVLVNWE